METIDIILTIAVLALVIKLLWNKFNEHPSDKYHNDSWKNRKK